MKTIKKHKINLYEVIDDKTEYSYGFYKSLSSAKHALKRDNFKKVFLPFGNAEGYTIKQ